MSGKPSILITGATGTIGQAITEQLIILGYTVTVVVRNLQTSKELFGDAVQHVVFNGESFSPSLNGLYTDIVIHLASYSTSQDEKKEIIQLINSNIVFVSLLLKELEHSRLKLFVNAGSFSEFHSNNGVLEPTYFYSATKSASCSIIDYFSKLHDFIFVNAVLYSVYGREAKQKKIVDYMIDATRSDHPIPMSEGHQVLDFIHIDDVVKFYLLLIQNYGSLTESYHEYHIGTGQGTSIRELAEVVYHISGIHPNVLWNGRQSRTRDTMKAIANTNGVEKELGWEPSVSLLSGLQKYMRVYGKNDAKL
jgi:nucleoside-diphosphate-sugar epimerase